MTADAKVGLLLGLVFIVIIAFLVNGLPQVLEESDVDQLNSPIIPPQQQGEFLHQVAQQEVQDILQDRGIDLRKVPPPDKHEIIIENKNHQVNKSTGDSLTQEQETLEERGLEVKGKTRTYVVQPGDSLGKIAKSIFGDILGNKIEVVDKIYQANPQLPNKHDIKVGQELTIPDLFTEQKVEKTQSLPNPEPGFFARVERVFSLGADKPAEKESSPPPQTIYATYNVRPDDTLWDIAQEKLGNGNRYKEILDLNKNKIKDPHTIPTGLILKLPKS
ncbi:MAG: LysM peptidoglycan-binding domain-containing protein [Sedimentisphaerales bacterium]|nr:LysM peptidoglycan-binding domain-containing protein [Sedimentisphaerales bacterium]